MDWKSLDGALLKLPSVLKINNLTVKNCTSSFVLYSLARSYIFLTFCKPSVTLLGEKEEGIGAGALEVLEFSSIKWNSVLRRTNLHNVSFQIVFHKLSTFLVDDEYTKGDALML